MERNKLIPSVDTNDLEPKTPWELQRDKEIAAAAEKLHKEQEVEEEIKPVKKERGLFVKALFAILIVGSIIGIGILLPIKLVPTATTLVSNVFNSSSTGATISSTDTASSTSSVFTSDKTTITTEELVKISWTGPIRQDGQYTLTFPCADGIAVILIAADGTKYAVPCTAPFGFISIDNTLTLAIQSRFQRLAEVSFTFSFANTNGAVTKFLPINITVINNFPETSGVAGSAAASTTNIGGTIIADNRNTTPNSNTSNGGGQAQTGTVTTGPGRTIFDSARPQAGNTNTGTTNTSSSTSGTNTTTNTTNNGGATVGSNTTQSNTTSSSNTNTVTPVQQKPAYYGKADLRVRVIAKGILDKNTGIFIPTNNFNSTNRVAVQFEIINSGTNVSGPWNFNAILPTSDIKTYHSVQQVSLKPNGRIVFTLGFDNLSEAINASMIIDADPANTVNESNESNNSAHISFGTTGSINITNADLKVTLMGVGRMNGSSFIPTNTITRTDRAAMQFRVTNSGGQATGAWDFKAGMTHSGTNAIYSSNSQSSLRAGESTIVTIAFDNPSVGLQYFEVLLDPSQKIVDATRNNNSMTASITVNN